MISKDVHLARWFPPDDPIATTVARLCILREDFFLESPGAAADEIPELDGNGAAWRQLYFLRQTFRTLLEAKSAGLSLQNNKPFREALKQAGRDFQAAVNAFIDAANTLELKNVRNNVGGHVKHDAVARLLKQLKGETSSITAGITHRDTHYKFAKDLAWRLVLLGASESWRLRLSYSPKFRQPFKV